MSGFSLKVWSPGESVMLVQWMVSQVGLDGFKEIRLQCLVGMEEGMDLEEAVEEYAYEQNTLRSKFSRNS